MPNGKCRSPLAAWIGWEAPPDDASRTQGRLTDCHAPRQLVEVLEEAREGERLLLARRSRKERLAVRAGACI